MSRAATGTVQFVPAKGAEPAYWKARVSCVDGSRPWIRLKGDWPNTTAGKLRAREAAASYSERFRSEGICATPQRGPKAQALRDNSSKWWNDYFSYRSKIGLDDVQGLFRKHVQPIIGDADIRSISLEDSKRIRRHLDDQIAAGNMAHKTAANIWATWVTLCKASSGLWDKDKDGATLRVRDDNPAAGVHPPDSEAPRQLQYLYPDEFSTLVACEKVPLVARRIYAVTTYLFLRVSELRALSWDDIDLEHGVGTIRYSVDSVTGIKGQTKTGLRGLRRFGIEPELLPLLRAIHTESGGKGTLFNLPIREDWADDFRAHLELAGLKRSELFLTDSTNHRIRFHDLRSTGLTWCALRGDKPLHIQSRAGHRSFGMTERYLRAAELLPGEGIGTPFPRLPDCLITSQGIVQSIASGEKHPRPAGTSTRSRDASAVRAPRLETSGWLCSW